MIILDDVSFWLMMDLVMPILLLLAANLQNHKTLSW